MEHEDDRSRIVVAVAQCETVAGDVEANLDMIRRIASEAADGGADLLVLPEMVLTGYAIGSERLAQLAEPLDGPSMRKVADLCRKLGLAICFGHPEYDGHRIYNALTLIDESGRSLLNGRKMHLYGAVDAEQFCRAEALPSTVIWHGWKIGAAICYDIEFPETARLLAVQGADLICVPTANMVGFDAVSEVLLPARGLENQVYVAYANLCGSDEVYQYNGISVIVGPDGKTLARAERGEALLYAELDKETLAASRRANPYLSDRRTDLYRLDP